jgi:hypothetical protein
VKASLKLYINDQMQSKKNNNFTLCDNQIYQLPCDESCALFINLFKKRGGKECW